MRTRTGARLVSLLVLTTALASVLLLSSCGKHKAAAHKQPQVPSIIDAYTSGVISRESAIRVRLTQDVVDSAMQNVTLDKSPLSFKPGIKGVAVWSDARTLEFRPSERLPQNREYTATFKLAGIVAESEGMPRSFDFTFSTMEQSFDVSVEGLDAPNPEDLRVQRLSGVLTTADAELNTELEKVLTAQQDKRSLPVSWKHAEDRRVHTFAVDSIMRGEDASSVKVSWNGKPIDVDLHGEREVEVPSTSSFTLSQARPVQGDETYIELRFSDPLQKDQNLRGLIRVDGHGDARFTILGSVVRVYSATAYTGSVQVRVEAAVKNSMGSRLKQATVMNVAFEEIKPAVRFVGSGVIVPTTQGLTIPIEAVNLRAVIVEATRVYEDNMAQFLQVNALDGSNEMQRVGRVVWKKTVSLDLTADRVNRWVRYGLDVSPLVKNNPGGMYRIKLTFTRRHIVYHCPGADTSGSAEENKGNRDQEQQTSYWDYSEQYADEGGEYNWSEFYDNRENPCHEAYYRDISDHNIAVSRNVLVSDIGLIAKKGSRDTLLVAVTDIRSAKPLAGASVSLYDYQKGLLSEAKADGEGMLRLAYDRPPFLIIARNGDQKGYLRLDDGDALSVSHFDVAGDAVQKGLKGFVYGERGVWRPGDSLFISFVLMDATRKLPAEHPVRLELWNARGQLVLTQTRTSSEHGFYAFRLVTDAEAPTGDWKAVVKVGGATFDKVLKVETIMPNRLKIGFSLRGAATYLSEGKMSADLSALWLHGAIARDLKADVEVSFAAGATSFAKYESYLFDDPARTYQPESQTIWEGSLDANGKRTVNATLHTENDAPGMLNATFRTRVFEPSGAFSVDRFALPYHPYERYVGIRMPKGDKARGMLLTDTAHSASVVLLASDGKPVSSGKVEVKLYKLDWRWWWEKGQESLADFVSSNSHTALSCDTVRVNGGEGTWTFRVKYPEWGRFMVRARDLNGKHATGAVVYMDWPGWAGRAQKDNPGGASVLSFASDKQEYAVGEKVVLTIPTAKQGRGLVSLETGSRVIRADWFEASGEATRYEFTATADMTPTVYANVTFLQPHMQVGNDLPIRMYGVIPIKVTDPATLLKPVIAAPEQFEPDSKAEVKVSEAQGKAMTYTLAIVDEGLLDLTRFETPDPWKHFYKREALGVRTWDLFDLVAGAYGGTLEKLLAIGGGDEGEAGAKKKANRFPPMVRFYGPFNLERGKTATHSIDIPQYIGSVRVMVVAGRDGAYGCAEKAVFVRKPLMVLGTLPRVLSPGEVVALPVAVFALDKKVRSVGVSVSVKGPLALSGSDKQKLAFTEIGDQMANFSVTAANVPGIATVSIEAEGGSEKARQSIEIEVRSPTQPVVDVAEGTMQAGQTWTQQVSFPGLAGTNTSLLEVSRIPPLNLGKRLRFLIHYPYGCVEQTTSSVFPQLYLAKLMELSPDKKQEVERNVKAGIDRLRSFQTSDGGMAYWPGNAESDEWGSNYAGNFLAEAEKAGYSVPGGMMDQWKKFERTKALSWTAGPDQSALTQAYRLYCLALAGAAELSAMNRLKETRNLPEPARWHLAAAYQLAGQPEAAKELAKGGVRAIKKYRELAGTYGSDLRDKAMVLEALSLIGETAQAGALVKEISSELSSQEWLNTQATAYCLIAIARYTGADASTGQMNFTYAFDGVKETKASTGTPIMQVPLAIGERTGGTLTVKNGGQTPLFARLITEGTPEPGHETAAASGLKLEVSYEKLDGGSIDPAALEQGTDLAVVVKVKNTGTSGTYEEIALAHLIASGWEIRNARMEGTAGGKQAFEYQDIRDDRVYTFFDIKQGETKTFRVVVNASYLGKFYLPMVSAEAMYDATINARVPGQWVEVKQAE